MSISGLVVEYIVAIDVTRVRFPADALFQRPNCLSETLREETLFPMHTSMRKMEGCELGGKRSSGRQNGGQSEWNSEQRSNPHSKPPTWNAQRAASTESGSFECGSGDANADPKGRSV